MVGGGDGEMRTEIMGEEGGGGRGRMVAMLVDK